MVQQTEVEETKPNTNIEMASDVPVEDEVT